MYQFKSIEDTIAAISTATAPGGIGIVRLSGKQALAIADRIFVAKNKKRPSQFKTFSVHYGHVVAPAETGQPPRSVDEALLTVMRSPHSYTGEDVVEISCHGGLVVLKTILQLAIDGGARLAEPGEFTKRAFLNGRIDLTQAEAVQDIIQAKTAAFVRVSMHQLKGELTRELEVIREELMEVYTQMEAAVNFPEDDIEAKAYQQIQRLVEQSQERVQRLLRSSDQGRLLRDGIKVVLCGRPNVGKSSLLNVLLRQPRAIVSAIAGTTRDTIEEAFQIQGMALQLVDTAGILPPRDLIEAEAVKRSHLHIQGADLALLILDGSQPLDPQDEELLQQLQGQNVLVVLNKCDLPAQVDAAVVRARFSRQKIVAVSALHQQGLAELETAIVDQITHGQSIDPQALIVSNVRHVASLKACRQSLLSAQEMMRQNTSLEFISEEIKAAINELDAITGRNIDQDLLESIFCNFCIGK